ncbi:uncharacterized protein CTRU02_209427 [Colletotrichum truncatum]|uniref:Uncharacterized protein n=1 Tax=Colletotrichum truncatum TaxID=5467 RepID=A0ACC3YTQ0_COLTU|nr:uncharacterized protein CTRU02_08495 [Colletotrichum truncatum]KAF6789796.1 hypothetical protein CTRU02_08495 [Colletotrichum truncatum]
MKSVLIFPALLATTFGAAISVAEADDLVADFTSEPFTIDDLTVEPYINAISAAIEGEDPEAFLNETAPDFDIEKDGAAAWAKIQAEMYGDVPKSGATADVEDTLLKWSGFHLTKDEKHAPPKGNNIWWPSRPGGPNDFHHGITADGLCLYLWGAAWKVHELRRPVQQFEPENVPWLIQNKGPYIYVLDGLREIEWVFWKVERSLQYASAFTEEEEYKIVRCYYQFSGFERQLTTLPGNPIPVIPRPASATVASPTPTQQSSDGKLAIEDHELQLSRTNTAWNPEETFKMLPYPVHDLSTRQLHRIPLIRRFGFKSLLRLIASKAPASRFQNYANSRITRVLSNLERSVLGASHGLFVRFQNPRAKSFIQFDVGGNQGLISAFAQATRAYRDNPESALP